VWLPDGVIEGTSALQTTFLPHFSLTCFCFFIIFIAVLDAEELFAREQKCASVRPNCLMTNAAVRVGSFVNEICIALYAAP